MASRDVRAPGALDRAQRGIVHLMGALVLVQAVLAGHSTRLFGSVDIVTHGVVGNVTFTVALAAFVLALVGRVPRLRLILAAVLLGLVTIQVGLGYTGRSSRSAAAWHVPLGVVIFGATVYAISASSRR